MVFQRSWFTTKRTLGIKKDYVEVEKGKQVYIIPAGREINKVLYTTPPTSQAALFANYAGIDVGFGGGYAQIGGGGVGSSVSSGGGKGPEVQGVGNAGTQAVMMGLQAKSIESQIALNNAQASKINAETEKTEADTGKTKADTKVSIVNADNIVEATKLLKEQQLSEQSKRDLNEAEKNYKDYRDW